MSKRNCQIGWFLYFLRCPLTYEVRYIGISTEPAKRFNNHLNFPFLVPNKPWIDSLKAAGLLPVQDVVLGPMTKDQADRVEVRLMRLHEKMRPGRLLQRVPRAKSKSIFRVFGLPDIAIDTPFPARRSA